MWRYLNGAWFNQDQVIKIEQSSDGYAILHFSDGSTIITDEEYEQFLKDGNILIHGESRQD